MDESSSASAGLSGEIGSEVVPPLSAPRPKDLEAIAELQAILEERQRAGDG